jgi:HEAT repeat protein
MIQDHIDLLSGYLINHFRYRSYFEGVEDAIKEFDNDPAYFEEMKTVFEYILKNQGFEENFLRDVVRSTANYFVSNDTGALKKLQFIYEDTILQEEEDEETYDDEEDDPPELKFDPTTMSVNALKEDIFDNTLDNQTRIEAALLLRKSKDASFVPTLLKAIQEKDNALRYGFILVIIYDSYWDEKIDLLSSFLLTDPYNNIRSSIADYIEVQGKKDFKNSEAVIHLLIEALKEEQHKSVVYSIISALASYESIAFSALLNNFDYTKEQNCKVLENFLNHVNKDIQLTRQLLSLLDSPSKSIKIIVISNLGKCYFPEVVQRLNTLLEDNNLDTKIRHYTELSLRYIKRHGLNK